MGPRGRRALLLWAFDRLYNDFAWSYDTVSTVVSLGRWRAWGRAALPFLAGQDVLELGHGPGHLLLALHDAGYRAVGLDLSPMMGRLAARRLRENGRPLRLARGSGLALPFAAASFDCVVATFPAPYIVAPQTLAAVRRVLRPGGRLVIVPEAAPPRAVEWLFRITGQRGGSAHETADFWAGRLGACGFAVEVYELGAVVVVVGSCE